MRNARLLAFLCIAQTLLNLPTIAAQIAVEGYIFEENNRGYLQQVQLVVLELPDNIVRAEIASDSGGYFSTALAPGRYRIVAKKDIFFDLDKTFEVGTEKAFLKLEMQRKPGYLFDVTVAEARENPELVVDAIQGATIEIFNRTQNRPELVLKQHPNAFFQHTFEQGNHYTILIRKPGFLAKRIEVYVNVKGCILCVDGIQSLSPGVTENLTRGNTMGTLLANIELERAKIDKRIQIQNIYYDFDKWDIRPDAAERLDNVVTLMKDNPGLSVELGSHTDSRGEDDYNMTLSGKRAAAAVAYIVSEGVDSVRITSKGYGESQLVNRCRNGVACSEEEHQQNRRTELRITGISGDSLEYLRWPSLEQIVEEEELTKAGKAKRKEQRARDRQLPEANNSVPLPEPKFDNKEEMQVVVQQSDAHQQYVPKALPSGFSGFVVEVLQADEALVAEKDAFLKEYDPIYMRRDAEGKFCYYIEKLDDKTAAQTFLKDVALPKFPAARLVEFKNGMKSYVE